MKKISTMFVFALMLGMLAWSPALVLAGEHGGSAIHEHGGAAMEGSHGEGDAAILQKAASILKASHPDLAAQLEAVAAGE